MKRLKPKQRARMAAKAVAGPRHRLRLVSDGGSEVSLGSSLDALLAIRDNDLVSATRILNQLRREGLDDDYCRQARALLCGRRDDHQGVIRQLESVDYDELFPGLLTLLGVSYYRIKDFDAAISILELALGENPEDKGALEYLNLARVESRTNESVVAPPPFRMRLILTAEECSAIAEAFPDLTYGRAGLASGDGHAVAASFQNAPRVAYANLAHPAMGPACAKMLAAIKDAAVECGVTDDLRIVEARVNRYSVGESIDWHPDRGPAMPDRRISITVQLSDPKDYEGGDLQVMRDGLIHTAPKDRGAAILFDSNFSHRVTPVTKGERAALIVFAGLPEASVGDENLLLPAHSAIYGTNL